MDAGKPIFQTFFIFSCMQAGSNSDYWRVCLNGKDAAFQVYLTFKVSDGITGITKCILV